MKKLLLLLGLGLLLAPPTWAADGDACSAAQFNRTTGSQMIPVWCVVVCDGDTADSNCSEFDLAGQDDGSGLPDVLSFELYENGTDCTAATVTINTSPDQGLTTASVNAYDLGGTTSLAIGGTTKLTQDLRVAPVDRYILATWSGIAGCGTTHNMDLMMIGWEEKGN